MQSLVFPTCFSKVIEEKLLGGRPPLGKGRVNTSNTSLTPGEPHKSKHLLSTMSSKHDSMCHGKICIEQNIVTQNPEFA